MRNVIYFLLLQENFVIVLPNIITVYSTADGRKLWEKEIDEEMLEYEKFSPFITRDVTGYFQVTRYSDTDEVDGLTVQVYNTSTGEFIASTDITPLHKYLIASKLLARGPYLCYFNQEKLFTIRFDGNQVKLSEYDFPFEHFSETCKGLGEAVPTCSCLRPRIHDLYGFLGRSKVLVGAIHSITKTYPFSLDLSVFFAAKNEEEAKRAFSFPLIPYVVADKKGLFWIPIYKTDRASGSVDIGGLMNRTRSRTAITMDNFFFVTEMDFT